MREPFFFKRGEQAARAFFERRRKRAWERKTESELVPERAETEQGELKKVKKNRVERIPSGSFGEAFPGMIIGSVIFLYPFDLSDAICCLVSLLIIEHCLLLDVSIDFWILFID